jgi:hypothetical protein
MEIAGNFKFKTREKEGNAMIKLVTWYEGCIIF